MMYMLFMVVLTSYTENNTEIRKLFLTGRKYITLNQLSTRICLISSFVYLITFAFGPDAILIVAKILDYQHIFTYLLVYQIYNYIDVPIEIKI